MDIQKSIADIIGKIKTDKSFAADFSKDPIKAVESVIGVDLPDEKLGAIVDGVKAQMAPGKDGFFAKIKSMFSKKS